jgi:hypothetical protein
MGYSIGITFLVFPIDPFYAGMLYLHYTDDNLNWWRLMHMSKIDEYRAILQELDPWDPYLLQESNLPGPRANLELAFAVAQEGDESRFLRYADLDELKAPANSQPEFLAFCGVLGLGYLAAHGQTSHLPFLRICASDIRWRIREAVALGLQRYGEEDMLGLIELMEFWIEGNHYERRAAVAALCEPGLLQESKWAPRIFDILDRITSSIAEEVNRKADDFKVLRKGLGYGWSVAVAAQPGIGKGVMENWIGSDDKDVRWIMKQNLKKKRLIRMDEDWVAAQLERLG